MAVVDLRDFQDSDGFVLHFGGRPNEVDTYTFAQSLIAFSDVFREINAQVNPHLKVELKLEAVGPGSFRGRLKGVPKRIADAFKWGGDKVVLPLLLAFFYNHYLDDDKFELIVSDDQVILRQGNDRVIIPRDAYDASQNLPAPEIIHEKVNKTIDAVEEDSSIDSFGITLNIDDDEPALNLRRESWNNVRKHRAIREPSEKERVKVEDAHLSIIKVVFSKTSRKWEFVWQGVKISAPIEDASFMADIMQGNIKVGNGDAIQCDLEIHQKWSEEHNAWLNERYVVAKVNKFIPRDKNGDLFADGEE